MGVTCIWELCIYGDHVYPSTHVKSKNNSRASFSLLTFHCASGITFRLLGLHDTCLYLLSWAVLQLLCTMSWKSILYPHPFPSIPIHSQVSSLDPQPPSQVYLHPSLGYTCIPWGPLVGPYFCNFNTLFWDNGIASTTIGHSLLSTTSQS